MLVLLLFLLPVPRMTYHILVENLLRAGFNSLDIGARSLPGGLAPGAPVEFAPGPAEVPPACVTFQCLFGRALYVQLKHSHILIDIFQ